jgi:3-phenylpropionate/trans-cinnamate dioxygenase ferredoxin reductase subunit
MAPVPSPERRFVVVGAGQSGAWVAKTLRTQGFEGEILLIGEEEHLPYERPPLSKAVLSGKSPPESACLLPAQEIAAARITYWPETQVRHINRSARTIDTSDGREVGYERLFLTTGARVRRLPLAEGQTSSRIHYLRSMGDAMKLRTALAEARRLAVIGAGWIGLEAAATARQMGLEVVVLEAGPLPCMRSVPAEVSRFLLALHAANGVEIRTAQLLTGVAARADGITLQLAAGELKVDHVLVGIGVDPETELAEAAGLEVQNGVVVDDRGQTSDPSIFAAGDVTNHPSIFYGCSVRLESWANAQNQAIVAARSALGEDVRHAEIPWIWSDQYAANIQMLGNPQAAYSLVLRGDPVAAGGCWLALDETSRAIGAVAVNAPKDLRVVRKALEVGATPNLDEWQDDAVPANRISYA